jgi:hypothetical protein
VKGNYFGGVCVHEGMTNLPAEYNVAQFIFLIRGCRVMLDRDLARIYGVSTGRFNEQVRRNKARFPNDFMFQLSEKELEHWRAQFLISNPEAKMSVRRPPYAFTEQGVAMLSSVLNSERAILVNIEIMRAFVYHRQIMGAHKDLANRLDDLEKNYDAQFKVVFEAIRELMEPPPKEPPKIGFQP